MHKEKKIRSVAKTVSWRFIATVTTFTLVLIFTGEIDTALTVGGLEVFLKMLFYFLHERGWEKIRWGKQEIQPFVVWITGLAGSGKSSIAEKVTQRLNEKGLKTDHLDGETIRDIFPETGFGRAEVNEHIKRVGLLASRLESKGVFVIASFISPYAESRSFVRKLCSNYIEIYLSTPVEVCEKRDLKGLYRRAHEGKIQNLAGVDVTYEKPEDPHLVIDTTGISVDEATDLVMNYLRKYL